MKQPAVIFDRDGTLASVAFSRTFVPLDGYKDWGAFNTAMVFDRPNPLIEGLLRSIRPGVARIMTTGRTDNLRSRMSDWLFKHELPIDYLFMRRTGDQRKDSIVKEEIYRLRIEPYFDVQVIWDDRPEVCEMWSRILPDVPLFVCTDANINPFYLED